jgi:hypothetical protein
MDQSFTQYVDALLADSETCPLDANDLGQGMCYDIVIKLF